MDEHYWIKKQIDFEKVDEASFGDIVSIKNSTNIEAEFIYYSEKFQFAADKVVNHLLVVASESNDIGKLDTWFFAVMYLYRQSLELILKSTVLKYVEDSVQKSEVLREARHDLQKCFELILNNQPSGQILSTVDCLNWIEAFLSNISSLDKQSDMFRYPFNQSMESFFKEQTHINLYATKNNLNIAYNILVT